MIDFLTAGLKLEGTDLNLYKHLINNNLNSPISLIKNKEILKMFLNVQMKIPIGGFIKVKPLNK